MTCHLLHLLGPTREATFIQPSSGNMKMYIAWVLALKGLTVRRMVPPKYSAVWYMLTSRNTLNNMATKKYWIGLGKLWGHRGNLEHLLALMLVQIHTIYAHFYEGTSRGLQVDLWRGSSIVYFYFWGRDAGGDITAEALLSWPPTSWVGSLSTCLGPCVSHTLGQWSWLHAWEPCDFTTMG